MREIIDNYNETNTDNITVQIGHYGQRYLADQICDGGIDRDGPSFVLVGIEHLHQYEENGLIEDISDFGIRWVLTRVLSKKMYLQNLHRRCALRRTNAVQCAVSVLQQGSFHGGRS